MQRHSPHLLSSLLERSLAWIILSVLLLYTYGLLNYAPYPGFYWQPNGRVGSVYVSGRPGNELQTDDRLIQIGPVTWQDFVSDLRLMLFADVRPGQVVPIVVEHQGQRMRLEWLFPGPSSQEFQQRLFNVWPAAYVFWLAGAIALLFARPRDTRWRLLIAFNFLTALWLIWGNISTLRLWHSAVLFRVAIWLTVPVYLHLHWIFPRPSGRASGKAWLLVYLAGIGMAAAQWLEWIPPNLYILGFTIAVAGSSILLIAHFILRPSERRRLAILVAAGVIALTAPIATGILTALTGYATSVSGGFLLTMPVLPAAYLYAAYRRQLGTLELRANTLFSNYLFFILLGAAVVLAYALGSQAFSFSGTGLVFSAAVTIALAVPGVALFEPFRRLFERQVLGIRLPPARLTEAYIAQIAASPTLNTLARLLRDEIAASLLIRQSALVHLDDSGLVWLYTQGLDLDPLPASASGLLAEAGRYRPPDPSAPYPWIRLVLALSIEHKIIGLWLLGRRDPDDYYAQPEIATLQSLAHQTAIALTNISQADRLRALYQNDIDRREAERLHLARELHDQVLQKLATLRLSVDAPGELKRFDETYEMLAADLRQIITNLRPAMLNYGLGPALSSLVDELSERTQREPGPAVVLDLADEAERYEVQVEQHLFRIVQQACDNALQHSRATTVTIRGRLESGRIELRVEDDGVGFQAGKESDPIGLMAHKHFGLAGIMERASLIHATLEITSVPGHGACVTVRWVDKRSGDSETVP